MGIGLRVEVSTQGIDDAFQGLSTDPMGARVAQGTGLRIPTLPSSSTGGARYLFRLATRTVSAPTRIRGIRQYATLGGTVTRGGEEVPTTIQAVEFPITTPNFYLTDGNISWHLVSEPNSSPVITLNNNPVRGATNLSQGDDGSSALLYTFPPTAWSVPQPAYYFNNMTAYAPPEFQRDWQPIGGLGVFHDFRFPWDASQAWHSLDIPLCIHAERRISLYASVLQTAGAIPVGGSGMLGPENDFIDAWSNLTASGTTFSAIQFWKVAGSIIFEDET